MHKRCITDEVFRNKIEKLRSLNLSVAAHLNKLSDFFRPSLVGQERVNFSSDNVHSKGQCQMCFTHATLRMRLG